MDFSVGNMKSSIQACEDTKPHERDAYY